MNAHAPHLAAGTMPLVGRVHEADAMRAAQDVPRTHRLPFVGAILACRPGASIVVARRLALDEDLFLADHNFVAPDVKALADCFPVVPMTVSLEIMAETAACLAPGLGLVAIERVTARRWIAVTDGGALDLRIEGRVLDGDDRTRIAVQVHAGAESTPAIEAELVFGSHYDAAPQETVAPGPDTGTLSAACVYAERTLFHGPRLQGLDGTIRLGADGARAAMRLRPAHDWFGAQPRPQLLTDPALLDTVGQLIGLWCMQDGGTTFPIGVDSIDLHGPTPPPGTLVPVTLHIRERQFNLLGADVEIGDGAGGTWIRIANWKSWAFHWSAQLVDFQRRPRRVLLAEAVDLPGLRRGDVVRRLAARCLAGFDLALLARHCLHASEMAPFAAKAAQPKRQREWLMGRIAAKDAARAWHAAAGGGEPLHPAAFGVVNDAAGQPRIALWPDGLPVPCISIAHSGDQAVALAGVGPVGIDIERIARRDERCLAAFSTDAERRLLAACDAGERDAWIARLWCAKEAFGKRLGSGVAGSPRDFEAQALDAGGGLRLRHHPSGTDARIVTVRDGDFVIAADSPATGETR